MTAIHDYDILESLDRGRYLRLWSKEMDNLETDLLGDWFIISRRFTSLYPDDHPMDTKLDKLPMITFKSDNTADLVNPKWKNEQKLWRVYRNSNGQNTALKIFYEWERPCRESTYTSSIWRCIQFFNKEILVSPDYILVKKSAVPNFTDFSSVLGVLTKFHIAGYWYISRKREELFERIKSKNKANAYMDSHQEELIWQLAPRFDTLKKKFWDKIDDIF